MNHACVLHEGEESGMHFPEGQHMRIKEPDYVRVLFNRTPENEICGNITHDPRSTSSWHPERKKIVFIYGWKPEKNANWIGPLPNDNEEWSCEVVIDTEPERRGKGALIVKLHQNLTALKKIQEEKARQSLGPIIDIVSDIQTGEAAKTLAMETMEKKGLRQAIKEYVHKIETGYDSVLLKAGLAWLHHLLENGSKPGRFEHVAKRDFHCCECNGINTVDKYLHEVIKNHKKGFPYACEWCGAKANLII